MQHENLVGNFPTFPKQLRSKQKREALIESAKLLFIEKGYEQTTAKEIAAHAKVATGTFYRYFSDKRQLLMTLIDDQIDSMIPLDLEWKSGDPVKLLAGRLEMHYHKINEKNLQKLMPELMLKDAELAEVVNNAKMRTQEKVLSHLKKLHKKGLMWPDIEIETLIWCLHSLLEKLQTRKNEGASVDYNEFSKVFCRMLFPPEIIHKMRTGKINEWKGP
ncbi:TetR/AcrR family transcriptional regulator [Planococcus sp. 1R117A]|uniref:TetR/AcrR family transcriptional regulator n=1 Tax=Planococcus sp. 1R117A TaxID=3447020 RepID=UPI003EDBDE12